MRDLDSNTAIELTNPALFPALFAEIEFESGWYRLWSGIGDKTWDSKTWNGVGDLGAISPIEETEDLRASGITMQLAGIDSSLVGSILGDARQGKPARVYLATLDAEWNIIGEPYGAFVGRVDVIALEDTGSTSTIAVSVENRLIDLERPRIRRWQNEDQHIDYPTDDGFEQVDTIAKAEFVHFMGHYIPRAEYEQMSRSEIRRMRRRASR